MERTAWLRHKNGRTQNWNNSAQLPSGSCLNYMNPVNWPTPEHGCHPHAAVEASLQQLFPWMLEGTPNFSEAGYGDKIFLWIIALTFFVMVACALSRARCNLSSCSFFCCFSFSSLNLLKGMKKGFKHAWLHRDVATQSTLLIYVSSNSVRAMECGGWV